jgi:hypothetical protein
MRSWKLEGRIAENASWELIDTQTQSQALANANSEATFQVEGGNYFRQFQLEQVELNAQDNYSIYIGTIDFSGKVILEDLN